METRTPADVRETRVTRPPVPIRSEFDETKSAFQSTEMWVFVAAVIGVLVATERLDEMVGWDGWRLVTALAIGYMLSRGLAKAGNAHRDEG